MIKKCLTTAVLTLSCLGLYAQNSETVKPLSSSTIQTAVPFLTVAPDARSGGMGDLGIASSPDAYSQHFNAAKYPFIEYTNGVSLDYTPWLNNMVSDMFFGNLGYYHRIWDRGVVAASFKFFSLGQIERTGYDYSSGKITQLGEFAPTEFSMDISYSMMLTPEFAMGVTLRYIRSNITDRTDPEAADIKAGNSFAADISGYFERFYEFADFNGRLRLGFNLSNIGPSISYNNAELEKYNKLPTRLGLGAGWDFDVNPYNRIGIMFETQKYLVPTPEPILDSEGEPTGQYFMPEVGLVGGMFRSLWKSPDGFGGKISEFSFQFGAEYSYNNLFKLRLGWVYNDSAKAGTQYLTAGFGFRYSFANLDFSYLMPTGGNTWINPLANTIRVSLSFDLGYVMW